MTTNLTSGLSQSTVLRQQEEEGFNELSSASPRRFGHLFFEIVKEPMVYLLFGCGAVYFMIGDQQEAAMLIGFLLLILAIELIQEHKAERAVEALRDLSSPRALVLREGVKKRIPGREVVRGDVLFLNEGDRVPADAMIVTSSYLTADESLLTGESVSVEKPEQSIAFAGTTIVRGQGVAVVRSIGDQTEIGRIGKSLSSVEREKTYLQEQTSQLVGRLTWISGAVCLFVFVAYGLTRADWLDGMLAGLTLAMAILPNELPAVLTIFLALGAWRISQRRVLTRKLPAIENLGAATVLCVDKTGTLTLNQMRIEKLYANGQSIDLADGSLEFLPEDFHEALEFGILASRNDPFDPMELAFVAAGALYLRGTEHIHQDWDLAKEYPLSPQLLAISHAWKPGPHGGYVVGAKGAPEAIIDLCHMSSAGAQAATAVAESMAREGLRVLGVAKSFSSTAPLPDEQHDFAFTFVGFIGIADPVRTEVPRAVEECRRAGVRVIMITGDHPVTACSIAAKIGLENANSSVTGAQLKTIDDDELRRTVKDVSVFSRVTPDQKKRLVEALKANGEVVAMTGDGVNDAPALKAAHIGIAMGGRGTDVARESAALVLLDDDFGSIVEAIRIGRRVYSNLSGAFSYLFSVHLPIAGMSVFPVLFKMPLVLLPAHIALLHLIIEPTSSVAFEMETGDVGLMNRPPRDPRAPLFGRNLWLPSLTYGLSVFVALAVIFVFSLHHGYGEGVARTLVFLTLMFANLALVFANRSGRGSLVQGLLAKGNSVVFWIAGGSLILVGLGLFWPSLRSIFRFTELPGLQIALSVAVGVFSVLWVDLLPVGWRARR